MEQLSPHATTNEPVLITVHYPCTATAEAQAPRAHPLQREKPLPQESLTTQLEKACLQQQSPSAAKT